MKPDVALTPPSCGDRERAIDHVADLCGVPLTSAGRLHTAGRQRPGNATEAADAAVLYLPANASAAAVEALSRIGRCDCLDDLIEGENIVLELMPMESEQVGG